MSLSLPEKMLRLDKVAYVMDVAPRTVENWLAAEELSYFKEGHVRRVHPEALAEFIVAHTLAARPRPAGCRLAEEDMELIWGRMQRLIETLHGLKEAA